MNFDLDIVILLWFVVVMNCADQEMNRLHEASYRSCPNRLDDKICRFRQASLIQQTTAFTRLAGLPDARKYVAGQNTFVGKQEQAVSSFQL